MGIIEGYSGEGFSTWNISFQSQSIKNIAKVYSTKTALCNYLYTTSPFYFLKFIYKNNS